MTKYLVGPDGVRPAALSALSPADGGIEGHNPSALRFLKESFLSLNCGLTLRHFANFAVN